MLNYGQKVKKYKIFLDFCLIFNYICASMTYKFVSYIEI